MEPIQHSNHQGRKKNTAKTNVTISVVIHLIIFALGAYWAAHEGVLGKKLQELSVGLLPKEKKAQEETKKAEAKADAPKKVETKTLEQAKAAAPPPPKFVAPAGSGDAAAPPPPVMIGDGAFVIDSDSLAGKASDEIGRYKQQVENMLRLRWDRPGDIEDLSFIAEIEMRVDGQGKVVGYNWKKGSGNERWDESVKKALASTKAVSAPPPKGFPDKFTVRFDVQPATEPLVSRAD